MEAPRRPARRRAARWAPALAALLAAAGCAGVRPLDPGAGPVALADGEGILVVHLETEIPLHALKASGLTLLEDVEGGEHLILLAAPAGTYRWDRLTRKFGPTIYQYLFDPADDRFRFDVEAGHINYPGQVILQRPAVNLEGMTIRDERVLSIRVVNRSATLFEGLVERHPALFDHYPMRYAGWGRDEFLERYLEARRRLSRPATAGESPP